MDLHSLPLTWSGAGAHRSCHQKKPIRRPSIFLYNETCPHQPDCRARRDTPAGYANRWAAFSSNVNGAQYLLKTKTMKAIRKNSVAIQSHARFILCFIILIVLLAYPTPVSACSCIMPGSPPTEFAQADAVFTGQVINILDKQNAITSLLDQIRDWMGFAQNYAYNSSTYGYRVALIVRNSWKGVTATSTQVTTGYGAGDCGYPFRVSAQYVIYAHGAPDDLSASICSRTTELSQAASDLSYLGSLPALLLAPALPTLLPPVDTTIFVSVVILIILAISWLLCRRRQATL